jgi:thioredoxin reductase (NADPH)
MLQIKNIVRNTTKEIFFDQIIVQFGVQISNNIFEIIKNLKKNKNNKIFVDRNQRTNIKNIFSIGDACTYSSKSQKIISGFGDATNAIKYISDILKN